MAFEFLKEMYRNSVMGMEAAREKEEARQRAIVRQEEEQRRIKEYKQHYLDDIHKKCLDKFGEGFSGKIYLGQCFLLYPNGLEIPKERTFSGLFADPKKHPKETLNLDRKKYETAATILKEMPEGVTFQALELEKGHASKDFDGKRCLYITTQIFEYTMQYTVTKEYSSRLFSRCCTEYVIHDSTVSEKVVQLATEFAERVNSTRQNVVSELVKFINKEDPIMAPAGHFYKITSTGIVGSKVDYLGGDRKEIEETFRKYGLIELDFAQRYGLALCLAKAAKPEGSKTFRYRLYCSPENVRFSVVHLPVKEPPKPEPILEQW